MARVIVYVLALQVMSPMILHAADAARVNGDLKVNAVTFGDNSTLGTSNGLMKNRGDWKGGVIYSAGDVVQNGGISYVCSVANVDTTPPNPSYWALLAAQGPQGATGFTGPQGPAGATGATGPQGQGFISPRAPVLATGQIKSYAVGDDGDWMPGASLSAAQRFNDNGDGSIKDNLTGLIWLKDAGCFATVGGITKGTSPATSYLTWSNALTWSNNLVGNNTVCNLNDGSTAGQWRLPNRIELMSLVDYSKSSPALPIGHPFSNVQSDNYWTSSTYSSYAPFAWYVFMGDGFVGDIYKGFYAVYVWPVRGGQ